MCKAAEVGKIVINKCIDRKIPIDAQKLQKLMALMQIDCIKESGKPLFKEDIVIWSCGVAIKEVNAEFSGIGDAFGIRQIEYINLLEDEENSVNRILDQFGKMDAVELNLLPQNQMLITLGVRKTDSSVPHISYQILMGVLLQK